MPRRPLKIGSTLLNFDFCTGGLDLFLHLVRLLLCHAFLDCFGRSFDQRLRFRKAKSRELRREPP